MTMQEIIQATKDLDQQQDALCAEVKASQTMSPAQRASFMERGEMIMEKRDLLTPIYNAAVDALDLHNPEQRQMMNEFARYLITRIITR